MNWLKWYYVICNLPRFFRSVCLILLWLFLIFMVVALVVIGLVAES